MINHCTPFISDLSSASPFACPPSGVLRDTERPVSIEGRRPATRIGQRTHAAHQHRQAARCAY